MDLLSLGFLFLILVVSGGIAYLADKLGKKLGKKRLSLKAGRWSMRPKHVAALGTVVMGVGVSFLTILFIALVSRDAREWLVEGRQLLVQLGERKKEVKQLEGQYQKLSERNGLLNRQNDLLKRQYDELQGRFGALSKRVAVLNGKVAELNVRLAKSQTDNAKAQSDVEASNRLLATSQRKLVDTRGRLVATQAQLADKKAELAKTEANLGTASKNVQTAIKQLQAALIKSRDTFFELKKAEAQVEALKKDIEDREAVAEVLRNQTAALIKERDAAEMETTAAQARYADLQAKLDQAGKELARLQGIAQQQYLFMATTFNSSRLEAMTFRANEEVARQPLAGGSSPTAAANALTSLLRAARMAATARGAKPGKHDGKVMYEVADVFGHQDENGGAVSGNDLKRALVAQAAGKLEDQVLVATSTLNAFAGEPVSLDIAIVPNPLVYHRNEVVAEARIDGSLDEGRILDQLSEFVRSRIRERALQDRMIPRAGTDAPFGEVKTSEVLSIVREVKRVGRSVRVQGFAEDDTRAADALRLGFRVR